MEALVNTPPPAQSIQDAFGILASTAVSAASAAASAAAETTLHPSSPSHLKTHGTQYVYFLGLELTPINVLFLQASVVSFFLQFIFFYTTWTLMPSLTKNRRGLGWSLSLYCSTVFFVSSLFEIGNLRTTLYTHLGLDEIALGIVDSPQWGQTTLFSYFVPSLHAWIQLGFNNTYSTAGSLIQSAQAMGFYALKWFISQPIFSLAPLAPTHRFNPQAWSPWLGGGGRLLFSTEEYPGDRLPAVLGISYFMGYCMGDLILGSRYYVAHVDPLSGWVHHVMYSILAWRMAIAGELTIFSICGGPIEASTIILAFGYVFPSRGRGDFWFPVVFFMVRIVWVFFILHELLFNVPTTTGAAPIYTMALVMHCFWFYKFFQGKARREKRQKQQQQEQESLKGLLEDGGSGSSEAAVMATAMTEATEEGTVGLLSLLMARGSPSSPPTSTAATTTGSSNKLSKVQLRVTNTQAGRSKKR